MINYENVSRLREIIEKAIEDHVITHEEYDYIISAATEDGIIDAHEQALLSELQDMLQDGSVKFRKK
ncbi:MAG: hypothetical protein ACOZDD_11575 [Bacteroidota bacterium]